MDDLDDLLALEEGLQDDEGASRKRHLQELDLNSLAEPRACQGGGGKRARTSAEDFADDELEDLAPRDLGCSFAGAWLDPALAPAPLPCRHAVDVTGDVYEVTCGDTGERVYCSLAPAHASGAAARDLRRGRGLLLGRPISDLVEEIERAALERALEQSEAEPSGAVSQRASAHTDFAGAGEDGAGVAPREPEELWVDRYRPRVFFNLLSDEATNRETLRWLKGWDACVFGAAHAAGSAAGGRRDSGAAGAPSSSAPERPEHKILLLCGAPGLGKTTLAHVAARHCGYRPVEINASDDRSAANLMARVADAVQMTAVLGARRPNCVVIDEIDGATGGAEGRGAINALIKLVRGEGRSSRRSGGARAGADTSARAGKGGADAGGGDSSDEEAGDGGSSGKLAAAGKRRGGRRGAGPLLRPIIAICNDLYAPALRPLRAVAQIVQFRPPAVDRIIGRLRQICAAEGLFVDRTALAALVERTDGDVRACLNTLQLLARAGRPVRVADVKAAAAGHKDMTASAFGLWHDLFSDRRGGRGRAAVTAPNRLHDALADFGDAELVLAGLHENFHRARFLDTHFRRAAGVLETLGDADVLMRDAHRRGDFAMQKYLPAAALRIHAVVAAPERVQLQWPKAGGEAARARAANAALLQAWRAELPARTFCTFTARSAVMEVLPGLVATLARPLRPVAPHLHTPAERAALAALVASLLGYAVTFVPEPSAAAATSAALAAARGGAPTEAVTEVNALAPPVHRLTAFLGMRVQRTAVPAAVRQLVIAQMQAEAIRQREAARAAANGAERPASGGRGGDPGGNEGDPGGSQRPPSGGSRLQMSVAQRAKEATAAAAAARKAAPARKANWLDAARSRADRRRAAPPATSSQPSGADAAEGGGAGRALPVRYQFHEGYTNAVKRPVHMRDLL
ncbi:hypothetical protein WJX81_000979 [Elliptochloris bilobata]|uniref:AAA+ ATPase domain-containing protein n=1 Tax=Elliptochloris bilobata TaxID=381761 RepID=A0AAW1QJG1_9CHLO